MGRKIHGETLREGKSYKVINPDMVCRTIVRVKGRSVGAWMWILLLCPPAEPEDEESRKLKGEEA